MFKRFASPFLIVFPTLFFPLSATIYAQDSATLKTHINTLASKSYMGRGYVGKGMQKAADYISTQFKNYGLQPLNGKYTQPFSYAINTFPSIIDLRLNETALKPGEQYLIVPSSNSAQLEKAKIKTINGLELIKAIDTFKKRTPEVVWAKWRKKMSKTKFAYYISHTDTLQKVMGWRNSKALSSQLPKGVFLISKKGKPIWPTSQIVDTASVIELWDSTLVINKNARLEATIMQKRIPDYKAENVMAMVPGTAGTDSFMVFVAHYDHIGKMGSKTTFPGASDNASGTAMLLALAEYYAKNPAKYNMLFIAFAGEEAGLLGSEYFVKNSPIDLSKIRFLINLDIFGDATNGIAVINGEEHRDAFNLLEQLNKTSENPLPEVRRGGKAANSDHHHFTEKGVPAFFIFTMGGKGWYHDIWDKADQVTLNRVPEVAELLKKFVAAY
jgi:aminopeptidase YwaD